MEKAGSKGTKQVRNPFGAGGFVLRVRTLGVSLWLSGVLMLGQSTGTVLPDAPSSARVLGDPQMKMGLPESPARTTLDNSSPKERIYPMETMREYPDTPSYTPLTRQEKFAYFLAGAKSGYTFLSAGITAATWHAYGEPPYGTGWDGYGKSYGAALSQRELGLFLQRYAMPVMFREDPRYFAAPTTDGVLKRGAYAMSRLVVTQADNGKQKMNCAYLLGGLASALIGNAYIRQRDSASVAQDFFVGMGTDAAYNIAREFWPSMRSKFPTRPLKRLGDVVIGGHGLPNPDKK